MRVFVALLAAAVLALAWTAPTHAGIMVVPNFSGASGTNNAAAQSYLQGLVTAAHPGGTVTVTGATISSTYDGDGHVVGPVGGTQQHPSYSSNTLRNVDGGAFLMNDTGNGYDRVTMTFNFKIYSLSFDYEIFPDGTTPDGTKSNPSNSNWPDFSLQANGSPIFTTLGVMPGTASLPYTHSPNSGGGTELAPQFMGSSGTLTFANGVSTLEFIDWPATIGISNLTFNDTRPVPEPASLTLLGVGAAGLCGYAWRRRRRPA